MYILQATIFTDEKRDVEANCLPSKWKTDMAQCCECHCKYATSASKKLSVLHQLIMMNEKILIKKKKKFNPNPWYPLHCAFILYQQTSQTSAILQNVKWLQTTVKSEPESHTQLTTASWCTFVHDNSSVDKTDFGWVSYTIDKSELANICINGISLV